MRRIMMLPMAALLLTGCASGGEPISEQPT
jgi:uncharacterized lipoprotein YmbA